jgi:hypothetical protein
MGDDGEDEEVMRKRNQGIYACQPFSEEKRTTNGRAAVLAKQRDGDIWGLRRGCRKMG